MIYPFDLRGPDFLVFYFWASVITCICMAIVRSRLDPTRSLPPPLLPEKVNPRELAWLRGGSEELARLTGLELLQRGFLRQRKSGASTVIENSEVPPPLQDLPPGAGEMMQALRTSRKPKEILRATAEAVEEEAKSYEARAEEESFLNRDQVRIAVRTAAIGLYLFLTALGGAKIYIGLQRNRPVVLIEVLTVVLPFFVFLWSRLPRLSARGRAFLKQAQAALKPLRAQAAGFDSSDPMLLMAAGAFGLEALAATSLAGYYSYYQPVVTSSGSSCSSGGSSCSSGSSCGGGSSCSSGSSCGGCSSSS